MSKPLLSILIPTRNRYKTLLPVIKAIAEGLDGQDFELVIQDNSDDNSEIEHFIKSFDATHIKYFYCGDKLSMVQNSELAISNSTGKYLCFIGDDDIVNPVIVDIVRYMDNNDMASLIYPIANYFYKDVQFYKKYGFNMPGALSFNRNVSFDFKTMDTKAELNRVVNSGAIYILDLPRLYHGVIKRGLIEQVKQVYGKFVPGPCPDMTTSTALATILDKHYRVNITLSIAGNSSISEGGKGPTNAHVVKLEDKSWLDQRDIADWNKNIPRIFSRETIWAQSVFHVLSLKSFPNINYIALYDGMIFSCPRRALKYVDPLYKELQLPSLKKYKLLGKAYMKRYIRQALFSLPGSFLEAAMRLRGDYNSRRLVENVPSIQECMEILGRETLKIDEAKQIISKI